MELDGIRVALLAENQYEDLELWYPYLRLQEAGAEVFVVGSGSAAHYSSKHGVQVPVDADADTVTFTADLPPGEYGASVLHDENRNGKMDKNFAGIPLEGYGVTNNPKPPLRAATYKEATFTLPPEGATMTISIQYF